MRIHPGPCIVEKSHPESAARWISSGPTAAQLFAATTPANKHAADVNRNAADANKNATDANRNAADASGNHATQSAAHVQPARRAQGPSTQHTRSDASAK